MRTRFTPETREAVLEGLRAGLTLSEAAQGADLPEGTLKGWLTRGRAESGTEHALFAAAADAARETASRADLTDAEFRACVVRAVRAGSVQGMKLWLAIRDDAPKGAADPFAELDAAQNRTIYGDNARTNSVIAEQGERHRNGRD
jgi:transposase-like protein